MSRKNRNNTSVPQISNADVDWTSEKFDNVFLSELKEEAAKNIRLTPDIVELEQYDTHLVFVYDSVKTGLTFHGEINQDPLFSATTVEKDYVLYKKKLGKRSGAFSLPVEHSRRKGPIRGEVYELDTEAVRNLDKFYANNYMFNRKQIEVEVTYRRVLWVKDRSKAEKFFNKPLQSSTVTIDDRKQKLTVWVYEGDLKFCTPLTENDKITRRVRKNKKGEYCFTDWEYLFDA